MRAVEREPWALDPSPHMLALARRAWHRRGTTLAGAGVWTKAGQPAYYCWFKTARR